MKICRFQTDYYFISRKIIFASNQNVYKHTHRHTNRLNYRKFLYNYSMLQLITRYNNAIYVP